MEPQARLAAFSYPLFTAQPTQTVRCEREGLARMSSDRFMGIEHVKTSPRLIELVSSGAEHGAQANC